VDAEEASHRLPPPVVGRVGASGTSAPRRWQRSSSGWRSASASSAESTPTAPIIQTPLRAPTRPTTGGWRRWRSFFGVHKIVVTPNGQYHVLMHGTTIHGAEKFKNDDGTPVTGRPEPITYYHRDGGIGQAIAAIRERKGAPLRWL